MTKKLIQQTEQHVNSDNKNINTYIDVKQFKNYSGDNNVEYSVEFSTTYGASKNPDAHKSVCKMMFTKTAIAAIIEELQGALNDSNV